jgi:hypothetical protein
VREARSVLIVASSRRVALAGGSLSLLLAFACSPPPSGEECLGGAAERLYYGSPEATLLHLSPGERAALVRVIPLPDQGSFCSGVVIGANWILSARHCSAEAGFRIEVELDGELVSYFADRHARHSELDVLLIGTPPGAMPETTVPLALAEPGLPGTAPGMLVQAAGFGATESGDSQGLEFIVSSVAELDELDIVIDGSGTSGACGGDSGGPLLIRDGNGAVRVLGLLTAGSASCLGRDRYARVDGLRTWAETWVTLAEPSFACGDFPSEGVCASGSALHCVDGALTADVCAPGTTCGWSDADSRMACIALDADPCHGVGSLGACEGNVALRCERGELSADDCGTCGAVCGRAPATGAVECR